MIRLKHKIALIGIIILPFHLSGQDVNNKLIKIQSQFGQSKYEEVLSDNNVPANPDEKQLYYSIKGSSAFKIGDIDTAIGFFEQAERLNPGSAALDLARCYKVNGNKPLLFRYLEEHLNSEYKLPRKDIILDPVFSDLDRDREWIRFWSETRYSEIDDQIAEAKYQISLKDIDDVFWDKIIQEDKNEPAILALIGQYYARLGEQKKADQYFSRAIALNPDNVEIQIIYGDYLSDNKDYGKAIIVFDGLLKKKPYDIRLYLLRVLAIFKSGQSNMGVQEIRRLEQLGIDASDIYFLLAKELVAEDPATAMEYLAPVIENTPGAAAFNLMAQANQAIGNDEQAIKDYAMSLDFDPKQADVYYDRGHLRLKAGDNDGACYDWQHALNLGHRKAADMLYKYCR